ncbi:MAG: bifunctional oligoribonuclease/PAP phosphatase NrnA [Bacteroidales bacterium]|nr:bifunctional oligoribonuclease/PAP phosphatase NrnA [Bacteroidales bacterium]
MRDFFKNNINKFNELFQVSKKIVIIGHHNPDGDALGGSLGLYNTLLNTKHGVSVIMPSKPTDFLLWMPNSEEIIVFNEKEEDATVKLNDADIIFCIDFNEASRTERAEDILRDAKGIKILIDHHPGPQVDAEFILSDTSVSSASELVYEFINNTVLKDFFEKDAATCIYTGIMTDTLNFSVNSSRQETFKIAGKLLSFGIDKDFIYDKVYNNFSINRLKLVGYLLYKKMEVIEKHNIAYIVFTKEEQQKFNFTEGDHEGIVNMPLSVSGIRASVIAIEHDNFIKLSLRSKGDVDVNKLSRKYFNGGGHKNAAGGKIYKPIEKAETYLNKSIDEFYS